MIPTSEEHSVSKVKNNSTNEINPLNLTNTLNQLEHTSLTIHQEKKGEVTVKEVTVSPSININMMIKREEGDLPVPQAPAEEVAVVAEAAEENGINIRKAERGALAIGEVTSTQKREETLLIQGIMTRVGKAQFLNRVYWEIRMKEFNIRLKKKWWNRWKLKMFRILRSIRNRTE